MEMPKIFQNPLVAATSIASVALIIVASVVAVHFYDFRGKPSTITVTGSTQQIITSDLGEWSASYSRIVGVNDIKLGSEQIKSDTEKVKNFLKKHNVADAEIAMMPITIYPNYSSETDAQGRYSQIFTGYTLSQTFSVKSEDIAKIGKLATESSELIASGLILQNNIPQYYYSKLADLKQEMVSQASADAYNRAKRIADSGHSRLGTLQNAWLGVIQITPETSSDISAEGFYDTTAIKKKVTIVVHSTFFVK